MPPTYGLEFLVEHMLMIGPGMPGPYGLIPLDFKEIAAYDKIGMLSIVERKAIRDLSRAYVAQLNISSDPGCPAPWVKGVDDMETYNFSLKMKEVKDFSRPKSLGKKRG